MAKTKNQSHQKKSYYVLGSDLLIDIIYSQIISRSNIFHHHFYLTEVNNIQVENDQGVLDGLAPWI